MQRKATSIDNEGTLIETIPERPPRDEVLSRVRHFISVSEHELNTGTKELSKDAEEFLLSRDWQGREVELENTVKKACILSEEHLLQREDFDYGYRQVKSLGRFIEERLKGFMRNIKNFEKFNLYETVIPEVEKALILLVLKETRGNQAKAAKLLGINRNTLRDKIKKLKIKK